MLLLMLCAVAALSSPMPVLLPGVPSPPSFRQYGGYVQVDAAAQRSLYYFFAESQRNAAQDPVVLWLTGGRKSGAVSCFVAC